jgi:hypothetical protein
MADSNGSPEKATVIASTPDVLVEMTERQFSIVIESDDYYNMELSINALKGKSTFKGSTYELKAKYNTWSEIAEFDRKRHERHTRNALVRKDTVKQHKDIIYDTVRKPESPPLPQLQSCHISSGKGPEDSTQNYWESKIYDVKYDNNLEENYPTKSVRNNSHKSRKRHINSTINNTYDGSPTLHPVEEATMSKTRRKLSLNSDPESQATTKQGFCDFCEHDHTLNLDAWKTCSCAEESHNTYVNTQIEKGMTPKFTIGDSSSIYEDMTGQAPSFINPVSSAQSYTPKIVKWNKNKPDEVTVVNGLKMLPKHTSTPLNKFMCMGHKSPTKHSIV